MQPPARRKSPIGKSEATVALAREELSVRKRKVETGRVRVRTLVRERHAQIDEQLERKDVRVQRVAVNRELDKPARPRYEGEVLVVPVMEEVLVVRKQLMLKEELRIAPHATSKPYRRRVALRSEEAQVERVPGERSGGLKRPLPEERK